MAKSLVTGGAGFIGAHVVRQLLSIGHDVVVLDDLSSGFIQNVDEGAIFIKGSINNQGLVNKIFETYQFDYVYHLAAYAAEGLSHFIRHYNYGNNLIGSINLINAAISSKVQCFVFTSSIAVYGAQAQPLTESATPMPETPYGVAKYAVEMDLKTAHEMFGLNYVIFRPHHVYGPNQNIGGRYRQVIGLLMKQLLQGSPLTIVGDGEQSRAFSSIHDVAPHIARCVDVPAAYNQIINIGGDRTYSINKLARVIMESMGIESKIKYLEAKNEAAYTGIDHQKAHQLFNINPQSLITLEEGVKEMVRWVKQVGVRKSSKFENIEINETLPALWLEE